MKTLLTYLKNLFSGALYNDLDEIPLYNWQRLQAGELAYIYKSGPFIATERAEQRYEELYNQFIERFGLPDEYRSLLERMQQCCVAIAEFIENPHEPINYTRKEVARIELEALMNAESGNAEPNTGEYIAAVEKHYGIAIDPRRTTVQQFFARVQLMKKEIKAHEAAIPRGHN